MFAGVKRRSSNIRVMQLFHELKQQFPTVPDHVVTACITAYAQKYNQNDNEQDQHFSIQEVLKATVSQEKYKSMGQQAVEPEEGKTTHKADSDLFNNNIEENFICDERNSKKSCPEEVPDFQRKTSADENNINNNKHLTTEEPIHHNRFQDSDTSKDKIFIYRPQSDMINSDCDTNRNFVNPSALYSKNTESVSVNCSNSENEQQFGNSSFYVKRPTHLDIKCDQCQTSEHTAAAIRQSERCFDIQKLLQLEQSNNKPPRSPISSKRFSKGSLNKIEINSPKSPILSPDTKKPVPSPKSTKVQHFRDSPFLKNNGSSTSQKNNLPSPTVDISASIFHSKNCPAQSPTNKSQVKECEKFSSPTGTSPLLDLSLKVDCSMGIVQSPTRPRRSSVLNVTPELPWCPPESPSQRSFTSVNLTLRPPSSEPQAPIDITSQNSSLTYSTSSFDSQKGLQSRLQITVGPGGGTVSSVRTRPNSSYIPQDYTLETMPIRAGSLPDLGAKNSTSAAVISKQQVRIDRLRIELVTEKGRLVAMQREVAALENPNNNALTSKVDLELEKQLLKEIKHLRGQCERLVLEVEGVSEDRVPSDETTEEFYQNIYTGQRGLLIMERPSNNRCLQYQRPSPVSVSEVAEGPKWSCPVCTFQNHPLLNKCEQCEMPRILHGSAKPNQSSTINSSPFGIPRHFRDNGLCNMANSSAATPSPHVNPQPRSFPIFIPNNMPLSPYAPNSYNAAINPNVNYCQNQRL